MLSMKEQKPAVWVGHVFIKSSNVAETIEFLEQVGARKLFTQEEMGVFELRGGTHIVLRAGTPEQADEAAYFDFMVENLDATHAAFLEQGLSPTTISRGRIHDDFLLSEPGGNTFRFNSSHVSRYPV